MDGKRKFPKKINIDDPLSKNRPKLTEFDEFVPWACKQYCLEFDVIVKKAIQKLYVSAAGTSAHKNINQKPKDAPLAIPSQESPISSSDSSSFSPVLNKMAILSENIIMIETIYNSTENLVQVKMLNNKNIPREIILIMALTIPHQKHLTSITINSGLHMDSLYDISKLLPDSQITELCLDGTFLSKANYYVLLTHGKLKHLSLMRCTINDAIVKTITEQLVDPSPAAKVLSALNLSSNIITDVGAKYIADMLRTNRQLSYLNLAGNMITDKGGESILDILQKFPLLPHELLESRGKYVAYLKNKTALINKLVKELRTVAFDKTMKKRALKRGKLESQLMQQEIDFDSVQEKAQFLAEKRMGSFEEVFSFNNTQSQNGVAYCFGNNTLCCLNFAYNNLTYVSVKKLLEVVKTQKNLNRTPRGLIRVVIEGNLMPEACSEFEEIYRILEPSVKINKKHIEIATKKKPFPTRSSSFSNKSAF